MKHAHLHDFAIASAEERRCEAMQTIENNSGVPPVVPGCCHGSAGCKESERRFKSATLQFPDRRQKQRRNPGRLPSSPDIGSGSLLPRPYLMSSKTAWIALDFAIGLATGSIILFASSMHLESSSGLAFTSWRSVFASPVPIAKVILFAGCVAGMLAALDLQPFTCRRSKIAEALLIASSVSLAAYGAMNFLVYASQANCLLECALTTVVLILFRILWRHHWDVKFQQQVAGKNVLIVGVDPIARDVKDHISSSHCLGIRFKGFVTLNEESDEATPDDDSLIIGSIEDVISLAKSMFAEEIIFSRRPTTPNLLSYVLDQAQSAGIDVRLIPSLSETLTNRADIEYLGNLPTIVLHHREKRALSNLLKRVIDIAFGSTGIIILSPLFIVIAVAIKLQSPGPVLYRSKRVGYKGSVFTCYKFRSMVLNAESSRDQLAHLNERHDILFKIAKDPRVTTVGAFLRKYSLDELPQLWNVLTGSMSLVGPRPSISSEVVQYKTAHLRRLDVIPGMTGLWQVEARTDPSFESYVNLDSKYVSNWSIWLDFAILARTVGAVLKGTGT